LQQTRIFAAGTRSTVSAVFVQDPHRETKTKCVGGHSNTLAMVFFFAEFFAHQQLWLAWELQQHLLPLLTS
jgi:hypothetical protein